MRLRPRTDENQAEIVRSLRACAWSVQSLASVGGGCPDLLVGARGVNVLLEVKDGRKPTSHHRLTHGQEVWHRHWDGQVRVVYTPAGAVQAVLDAINNIRGPGEIHE